MRRLGRIAPLLTAYEANVRNATRLQPLWLLGLGMAGWVAAFVGLTCDGTVLPGPLAALLLVLGAAIVMLYQYWQANVPGVLVAEPRCGPVVEELRTLSGHAGVEAVPALLYAMTAFPGPVGAEAVAGLLRLLPAWAVQGATIDPHERDMLHRLLGQPYQREVLHEVLAALALVGDGESARRIGRLILAGKDEAFRAEGLFAQECLDALEARLAREREAGALLRPATAAPELVRPASDAAGEAPVRLLRSAGAGDEQPLEVRKSE